MNPILFQVTDSFFIGTYGLLIVMGLMAGLGLSVWLGKPRGFSSDIFFDLLFIAVISGFIGARILYILTDIPGFIADPAAYLFSRSGFVFLGGLIGATIACGLYVRKKNLSFWQIGDILLPALAIGHAFGRFGCHFAGCCFGGRCDSPLGITLPRVELPDGTVWPNVYVDQIESGVITWEATRSLPVWPVQMMEAGGLLILAAAMVLLFLSRPRIGTVMGVYFTGYAILRFLLEYLRGDEARGYIIDGVLSTSQGLSLLVFAGGLVAFYFASRNPRYDAQPAPTAPEESSTSETAKAIKRRRRK